MTPSLEIGNGNWAVKSDSLLGYKTIDGKYYPREIGVTRATTATRINANGLVELTPYNLLTWSEQFDNAAWLKDGTITPNTTIAPNGTLTADTWTTALINNVIYQAASVSQSTDYTFSFYVKRGTLTDLTLSIYNVNSASTIVSQNYYNQTSSTEWVRITKTFTTPVGCTSIRVYPKASSGGIAVGTVFFWGAQLVEGTEPLDYLPTTDRLDIARIDYSSGEAALLAEPQRTNLCSNNLGFSVFGGCTIVSEATNSPFGNTSDVFKVTSLGAGGVRANENIPFTSGNTYSCGHFIKFVTSITLNFYASAGHFPNTGNFIFDVSGNPSKTGDVDYIAYPNGWYYVYIKASVTSTVSARVNINSSSGSFLIFKSQYELGAYPTSYIPTTSAAVTRNADVVSMTNASAYIGQTEGTIFLDIDNVPYNSDWLTLNPISGSPYANGIGIGYFSGSVRFQLYSPSGSVITTITSISGRNKIAIGYKSGDTVIYINGVNVFSNVGTFSFSVLLGSMTVGSSSWIVGSTAINKIYSHKLYNTRLSNAELATLTTI